VFYDKPIRRALQHIQHPFLHVSRLRVCVVVCVRQSHALIFLQARCEYRRRQLGCDVNVTKGFVVSEMRHQWGFNSLIGETDKKERTDHRHHAIDAKE
jgi:hypothetical protein